QPTAVVDATVVMKKGCVPAPCKLPHLRNLVRAPANIEQRRPRQVYTSPVVPLGRGKQTAQRQLHRLDLVPQLALVALEIVALPALTVPILRHGLQPTLNPLPQGDLRRQASSQTLDHLSCAGRLGAVGYVRPGRSVLLCGLGEHV